MLASNPQFVEMDLREKSNIDKGHFKPSVATYAASEIPRMVCAMTSFMRTACSAERIGFARCTYDKNQVVLSWAKMNDNEPAANS
jgi:hypothetical protein